MTRDTFKHQLREYAIDELATVDGVDHPCLAQIKAKEKLMMSWPIIQAALGKKKQESSKGHEA